MANAVLIPEQIMAMNVDSLNRSVISSASSVDNGNVFYCTTRPWTSGSGAEVFNIANPSTSGSLAGLWMAYSGDEIPLTASKYKGLDPDPRNFTNLAGQVFSAFKPQVGDIILLTGDGVQGTVNDYAVATDGARQLTWSATPTGGSVLAFKRLQTTYISLATGGIDSQRVTAYELECIYN